MSGTIGRGDHSPTAEATGDSRRGSWFASPRNRHLASRITLLLILLLALALRVAETYSWNRHRVDGPGRLVGDEAGYDGLAMDLLAGYGHTWAGRVPGYPLLLAGLRWLGDGSYAAITYLQIPLGLATVLGTYLVAREAFSRRAGLLAALGAAVSYVLIHQSLHLLSEVLFTPIVLFAAYLHLRALRRAATLNTAAAGALIGLSSLVRPTLLLYPFFAAPWFSIGRGWRPGVRLAAIFALASCLVVTPWIVRNYFRYGAWFPLATSNAILWQGSPEYYRLIHDRGYTYGRIWDEVLYPDNWREHDPTSVEGDRWWTRRALDSIRAEPHIYVLYALMKVPYYWVGDPNADWNDERIFSYGALRRIGFRPNAAVHVMIARALPLVALIASAFVWRRWRRLWPIFAVLIYTTLLHAATHAEVRLSEPFQPLLLVIIAGALLGPRVATPNSVRPPDAA